jgi:hypothetical protein
MTYLEYEATRLFVTAEEEDAEREAVVVAPGMPEEEAPFDNQLRGLPDTDEIVQLLPFDNRDWPPPGDKEMIELRIAAIERYQAHAAENVTHVQTIEFPRDADLPRADCGHYRKFLTRAGTCLFCDLEVVREECRCEK